MNLWDIFFTTQATEPPQFDFVWYVSLFTLLALTFYASYRYYDKKGYQRFFQILQAVQLILLYSWYWGNHMPLSESLPFYHCRMAMFVVLLLPLALVLWFLSKYQIRSHASPRSARGQKDLL